MIGQLNNNDLRRYVRESIKAALVDEGFDRFVGNALHKTNESRINSTMLDMMIYVKQLQHTSGTIGMEKAK